MVDQHFPRTQTPARILFLAALLVGLIGMFVGAMMKSPWIMGIVPIASMFAYVFFSIRRDTPLAHIESFADSVYFLGFLFTLVSLAVSLRAFAMTGDDGLPVSIIISAFAVAILTTIVGLGIRIFLVNFSPPVEESEARAKHSVAEAGMTLSRQMDQLSQSTVGRVRAYNEAMDQILEGSTHALNQMLQQATESMTETVATTRGAIDESTSSFRNRLDESSAEYQTAIGRMSGELTEAGTKSGRAVRAAADEVADGFRTAETQFQKSLKELREPQAKLMAALHAPLEATTNSLEQYHQQIAALSERQNELGDAVEGLAGQVGSLSEAAGGIGKAASEIKRLEGDIADARKVIKKLATATTGLGEALASSVEALEEHNQAMATIAAGSKQEAEEIVSMRARLRDELTLAAEDFDAMRGVLIESADFIRSSLGPRR